MSFQSLNTTWNYYWCKNVTDLDNSNAQLSTTWHHEIEHCHYHKSFSFRKHARIMANNNYDYVCHFTCVNLLRVSFYL